MLWAVIAMGGSWRSGQMLSWIVVVRWHKSGGSNDIGGVNGSGSGGIDGGGISHGG
jgi:hypothetical protein